MVSKLWFRFRIPLGSAVVLAALLDLAISAYWFLNDFGSLIYNQVLDQGFTTGYKSIISLVAISARFFLALSLWIFVLLAQRAILLFWIPLSVITDIIIIGYGINNYSHDNFISDEIWFINIAVIILLRSYLTTVIYQAFHRLLQNARAEAVIEKNIEIAELQKKIQQPQTHPHHQHNQASINNGTLPHQPQSQSMQQNGNTLPGIASTSNTITFKDAKDNGNGNGDTNAISKSSSSESSGGGVGGVKEIIVINKNKEVKTIWENLGHINKKGNSSKRNNLKNDVSSASITNSSPRFLLIEPIGFSPIEIFQFYNDTPRLGAAVLVLFEVIWNVFALSTHSFTEFMMGGNMFFMLKEEEIIMRVWRIVIDVAALIFIFNKKKTMLRFWLIIFFWTLFASLCIFVYAIADWINPHPITVIVTLIIWFGDNCIRFGILYFCLRTTILPPFNPDSPGVDVRRSHSLRSQTKPRSRKMRYPPRAVHFDEIQQQPVVNLNQVNSIEMC